MLLRKALRDSSLYCSAKPKSTRTGTFFSDSKMFAGLMESEFEFGKYDEGKLVTDLMSL